MSDDFNDWRTQIKLIDAEIIKLLEQRFDLVGKIGEYKKMNNLPVRDQGRERQLISEMMEQTKLAPKFIENFYQTLFSYSYLIEK